MSVGKPQQKEPGKLDRAGKIFIEEITKPPPKGQSFWRRAGKALLIPILAIITGLLISGLIIIISSEDVYAAFGRSIGAGLQESLAAAGNAYWALFTGAFGDPVKIATALASGEAEAIRRAFNPFFESLVASTPYIFAGLSVALGFQAGLFNIGAEGQLFVGAIFAAFVGYAIDLPMIIHLPLAIFAGMLGGAIWGFIPGLLKAKTGGHEVINTIMMNYIAFRLSEFLLRGVMKRPDSFNPISPFILDSAKLPRFFGAPIRFHMGFFVALLVAFLVWWFLYKTKWGFDFRSVGANPNASRYAGMSIVVTIIAAMSLAGALAGLAGTTEVLGLNFNLAVAFSSGYGFDAIAIALLGRSHPLGVVLAALLFGVLRNGATRMQLSAGIPIDIISVLQAMILVFIATPAIIRTIYRLPKPVYGEEEEVFVRGWGGD
jgi:simple sugar transport system permease protein